MPVTAFNECATDLTVAWRHLTIFEPQDAHVVVERLTADLSLFGIFDGHGGECSILFPTESHPFPSHALLFIPWHCYFFPCNAISFIALLHYVCRLWILPQCVKHSHIYGMVWLRLWMRLWMRLCKSVVGGLGLGCCCFVCAPPEAQKMHAAAFVVTVLSPIS